MTLAAAGAYAIAMAATLILVFRWEVRRARGRSAARPRAASARTGRALKRWLSAQQPSSGATRRAA